MSIEFKDPLGAPPPAANYRNLAIVSPEKRLLIISGQIGNRMDGSIINGLEAQYEQALANINAIIASEGGTSIDIAKITIFLTDLSNFASVNEKRKEMRGPNDIRDILSGLKTKKINLSGKDEQKSTISIDDMNELNNQKLNRPRKSRRKPKSERNTISLDL